MGDDAHQQLRVAASWKNPIHLIELLKDAKLSNMTYTIFISPESANTSIPRTNPVLIKAELEKLKFDSKTDYAKFTRKGHLIVQTKKLECLAEIDKLNTFANIKVRVNMNPETFTTKFLVRDIPTSMSLDSVHDEISEENQLKIVEMRRFLKRGQKGLFPTQTVLVTILGTTIPEYIRCWQVSQSISIFSDSPRNCNRCFKFNHSTKACTAEKQVCVRCGKNSHSQDKCDDEMKCVNCDEAHVATDKTCKARQKEFEFLKYKCTNHLSFSEARQKYFPLKSTSFSSKVTQSAKSESVTKEEYKTLEQAVANQTKLIEELIKSNNELKKANEELNSKNEYILCCLEQLLRKSEKRKMDDRSSENESDCESMKLQENEETFDFEETLKTFEKIEKPEEKKDNPEKIFSVSPAEQAKVRALQKEALRGKINTYKNQRSKHKR